MAPAPVQQQQPGSYKLFTTVGHVATGELANYNIRRDDGEIFLELDIYQITAPYGSISGDDRFWKHIDEDHINLRAHDVLQRNGIRYGEGSNSEWKYFESIMEREGATSKKSTMSRVKKRSLDFPLRTGIESETIWFMTDVDDHLEPSYGHTYEKCDNLFSMSFEPTPRRPGDTRIAVCAVVRNLIKEIRPSPLNEPRSYEWFNREHFYDLRLREDVPMDHFLVIATAPLANLPDNLGHTFPNPDRRSPADGNRAAFGSPPDSRHRASATRRDQAQCDRGEKVILRLLAPSTFRRHFTCLCFARRRRRLRSVVST